MGDLWGGEKKKITGDRGDKAGETNIIAISLVSSADSHLVEWESAEQTDPLLYSEMFSPGSVNGAERRER